MKPILPAFLSVQGGKLSDDEKRLFAEYNPLGVCLFSRFCENVQNRQQLRALCKEIKEVIGRDDVLIAVDQEGGRVRRLQEPECTPVSAQQNLTTAELAKEHAYLVSADLRDCGINVNFAPVLDIMTPQTANVLQGRCFPHNVAELGQAMVDEYMANGICPCVKHLPGHGRAVVDPHLELPVIEADLAALQTDFAPFKALHNCPMGMVAHIVLPAIDGENAASVSAKVIREIIRGEIGFGGLLVSDAIVMQALKGSIAEKAERAVAAGCEVICLGNSGFAANVELCQSKIVLSDAGYERLQKIKQIISTEADFTNYAKVKNNYCNLLKNIVTYDYNYDATEVLNRLRKQ